MPQELNLNFKNSQQVTINLAQHSPVTVDFAIPLTAQDREAIRHYLEVYAAQYVMDIDDTEAKRVSVQLSQWGQSLFDAVFNNVAAQQLFAQFINTPSDKYLVTITAQTPEILSLPWELLHEAGQFLFAFQPSITILRRIPPKTTFPVYASQSSLRMLFVISRPQGAGFIDPRTDAQAVLKAIANYPAITVEFLQPATLENLWQRLQNSELPRVDVIHFDGHGYFDKTGDLAHTTMTQLSSVSRDLRKQLRDLKTGANTGYLLFEQAGNYGNRGLFYVPTSWLAYLLSESSVRLMVLSACQSAMVAHDEEETEEEPIGSIAVGLVASSVPSVLAMSYSVMVRATELLFGGFYREIALGKSVGVALDKARQALLQDRKRRDLQRGQERVEIEVSDWFLPTLYQAGEDNPLLLEIEKTTLEETRFLSNLPELQEAGFVGRKYELWIIERAFVQSTRRLTLSGFGGQGKTYLAIEAGQWLCQTGMFEAVCFINYASFQGMDAVGLAVSTLATVLEVSLIDAKAATLVLAKQPLLLIFDNLETLAKEPLRELLDVAEIWSQTGKCRVLLTTRSPDFHHPAYPSEGSLKHLTLSLQGLTKVDALDYFQKLLELPPAPRVDLPKREVILELFEQVGFHPLSIGLLGKQLKLRRPAELGLRLEKFIAETPDNPLLASLNLSLDKIDEEAKRWLPRLGVFQGGAMEPDLLDITELSEEQWQTLHTALETTGLIQTELMPGVTVPYIRFHPTLAPALKTRLAAEELEQLLARHQECYYQLSGYLYHEDQKNPHQARAIVLRELPNLLYAVKSALAAKADNAVEFVETVNWFLKYFGLNRDRADLTQQAEQIGGYLALANKGKLLWLSGNLRGL
ncbi:CHAT domain-containing protein [Candidatus Parabeggiatoa sp. HSG14]|uniref:CHAT domain-containing protein n=1 Tax=Candidatus Parabeggiatoa sp. HSG14 TaxID=3055593 RepID=UPI0025A8457B|nr:CHAT domain-containing protein [Thiotrichales bacterium HSG14]